MQTNNMSYVIYSPRYNIHSYGLERLHPFDSRKYGRAYARLQKSFGPQLRICTSAPLVPMSTSDLLEVHCVEYLAKLHSASYLANALEIPLLKRVPASLTRYLVLRPMRWGCSGTILAGREALTSGFAVNMSGGYHHAKPSEGESFCIYNDIALLISDLRHNNETVNKGAVAYVDLDAHQGNGVCHCFLKDSGVFIFDMYNSSIYPAYDTVAKRRIDCALPLDSGCSDIRYLDMLHAELPRFLDALSNVELLIYNAGTDVLCKDPLGGLDLSAQAIKDRDRFVVQEARKRHIPVVMLLSGGYTSESHIVIAESIESLLAGVGFKSNRPA